MGGGDVMMCGGGLNAVLVHKTATSCATQNSSVCFGIFSLFVNLSCYINLMKLEAIQRLHIQVGVLSMFMYHRTKINGLMHKKMPNENCCPALD